MCSTSTSSRPKRRPQKRARSRRTDRASAEQTNRSWWCRCGGQRRAAAAIKAPGFLVCIELLYAAWKAEGAPFPFATARLERSGVSRNTKRRGAARPGTGRADHDQTVSRAGADHHLASAQTVTWGDGSCDMGRRVGVTWGDGYFSVEIGEMLAKSRGELCPPRDGLLSSSILTSLSNESEMRIGRQSGSRRWGCSESATSHHRPAMRRAVKMPGSGLSHIGRMCFVAPAPPGGGAGTGGRHCGGPTVRPAGPSRGHLAILAAESPTRESAYRRSYYPRRRI